MTIAYLRTVYQHTPDSLKFKDMQSRFKQMENHTEPFSVTHLQSDVNVTNLDTAQCEK